MSNLDDKLLAIVLKCDVSNSGVTNPLTTSAAIAEIHQAFIDEGWIEFTDEYMTSQDWYDRFLKEYRSLSPKSYSKDQYAKMAAKKAAGL